MTYLDPKKIGKTKINLETIFPSPNAKHVVIEKEAIKKQKGKKIGKKFEILSNEDIENVRILASAEIKSDEAGLLEAALNMGVPVRFIKSEQIKAISPLVNKSEFVEKKTGLPAVAEPAALLAGRRTKLILQKHL